MRPIILTLLALGLAVLPYGCDAARGDKSNDFSAFRRYGSSDGRLVQGTLTLTGAGLSGVTQLADGTCLAETATTDASGRLVRAEAHLAGPDGGDTRVVIDAADGAVGLATPPWPVCALRGSSAGRAVRALDLRAFESHSVMDDQPVVANDES